MRNVISSKLSIRERERGRKEEEAVNSYCLDKTARLLTEGGRPLSKGGIRKRKLDSPKKGGGGVCKMTKGMQGLFFANLK